MLRRREKGLWRRETQWARVPVAEAKIWSGVGGTGPGF